LQICVKDLAQSHLWADANEIYRTHKSFIKLMVVRMRNTSYDETTSNGYEYVYRILDSSDEDSL